MSVSTGDAVMIENVLKYRIQGNVIDIESILFNLFFKDVFSTVDRGQTSHFDDSWIRILFWPYKNYWGRVLRTQSNIL